MHEKKIYIIRKIEKGQEKVSGLKSPFGVIKFDTSVVKMLYYDAYSGVRYGSYIRWGIFVY